MVARLYPVLLWAALPLVKLRLWWRARHEPAYGERQQERFGAVPAEVRMGPIWFHTVSAGESIAAAPLIRRLVDEFPDQPFLVTTMTPTGSQQVRERLGDVVDHCYAPYDFGFAVQRFFERVQPKMLVLMETELWPNLIAHAARRQIPVILMNGRLSERSARGYGRVSSLTLPMLQRLRFIACQTNAHAQRFIQLGAAPERTAALGSVKFDVALAEDTAQQTEQLRAQLGLSGGPVWIAASTHPGEEAPVLRAFGLMRAELPTLQLILVPRHPARTGEVIALVSGAGFTHTLHSEMAHAISSGGATGKSPDRSADVLIGDVMGTLLALYGLADVAFVGGSLVPVGGHNPIEPALHRLPIVTGPHRFNFAEAMAAFTECGALFEVDDAQALASVVCNLLKDGVLREQAGGAGYECVQQHRGATARLYDLLRGEISVAVTQ